ncbi:MAG: hypothetical protein KGS49_09815 [Planctomycetes bacterium]|nr:hypothetical protein [Planctomycetota bacterium]
MSGFSPAEIPILGDKSLPWFDPDWPWNLGRVASFAPRYSFNSNTDPRVLELLMKQRPRPIIEIDFSKVSAVAMWAGSKAIIWDDCEPQQILVRFENQWLVLLRHISEMEVQEYFNGDIAKSDCFVREGLPYPTYVHLGSVGDRSERVSVSTDYDYDECKVIVFNPVAEPFNLDGVSDQVKNLIEQSDRVSVECFAGDYTVRNAVNELAHRGFVQSKYWPTITSQFPEFDELRDYLISLGYLYPDGSHPLHGKTSEVSKQPSIVRNGDGIDSIKRTMTWGGKVYTNIPARTIKVLTLLLDRYKKNDPDQSIVELAEIVELGVSVDGGMKSQVFKGHRVGEIVEKASKGRYRLKTPD